MRTADFYFDFISPFAYFGFKRLKELPSDLTIRYRPVLFAGLLEHWGQKGPAEIPPKRQWLFKWCLWQAQQYGVDFRVPGAHPFNPLRHLRLAIAAGNTPMAIERIYDSVWTTGLDPADDAAFERLIASLNLRSADIARTEVKEELRRNTEEAASLGIFGVPTLMIDGEPFWGADAIEFAKSFLQDPSILKSPEMLRAREIPVGASRKLA
jgi:2-hydroxychromene-2-carboxylate isomerase